DKADLRPLPSGVMIYGDAEQRLDPLPPPEVPRAEVIDELYGAIVEGRAPQGRLAGHGVPFGHWTFLRVLWERDGLTQRELSDEAGVMEPTTFAALRAMEELGYIV